MDRLGDLDREVLALALWEELTPAEIARVIGVATGAVRTRLSRVCVVRRKERAQGAWEGRTSWTTPRGACPAVVW